ncbi:hypothetical protein KC361_g8667 [Hortaea werneckii]|nr:hypothetical protein KC361_g8667 [Hortaea werneckii]
MPPPPYDLHLSSSQPVRSTTRDTRDPETLPILVGRRKRNDDRTVAHASSCLPTLVHQLTAAALAQTRDAGDDRVRDDGEDDGKDRKDGGDDRGDSDEEVVVSAPLRKKRKTKRSGRKGPP